jgi:predicted alpha-1,2-mannosidase
MKKILIVACLLNFTSRAQVLNNYVNPFIGTGGHGHTFPGAVLPFGMVQLSPDTRVDGSWDGCGGYHYNDSLIYGFSHTHLSGTGVSDWGDILLMPGVGAPSLENSVYASSFSHKNEKAAPGQYEVILDKDKIKAELTVTPRVGIHRYTFPKSNEAFVILDLLHRDKLLGSNITIKDSCTITGYRISQAWAKEQHVYFAIRFSKPFLSATLGAGKKLNKDFDRSKQSPEGAVFRFNTNDGKPVVAKVAISPTSEEGAVRNLEAEATHWNFEKYRTKADSTWNAQLMKIEVVESDKDKLTVFYTALYHCFIHPSLNMDVDGQYRGRDNKIHTAKAFSYYSVFSLWDTYRALHPLLTLLEPKRTADFINTFLAQYKDGGRLPMWELSSNETDCMIGFHAVSVIADAMAKGVVGFDTSLAYEAAKAAAEYSAYGIPEFNRKGYLEAQDENESVSKTLEYSYDNWCISMIATMKRNSHDIELYRRRALGYRHLFDPLTGFMRPRYNGSWIKPFFPEEVNNHFTEGNSWQYSFYAPHDMLGLIDMHGGRERFEKKLDDLFAASSSLKGREQPDVTGMIGQYAHGNEPSHHIAYLYNFVGKPQKTIDMVEKIMSLFYKNAPDGLIGNEDCGQMSAWYVFSALGMYPVCPGIPQYVLAAPAFSKAFVNLEDGKRISISSNRSQDRPVLKAVTFFGGPGPRSFAIHNLIKRGIKLDFVFTAKADSGNFYGKAPGMAPKTMVQPRKNVLPAPVIVSSSQVFRDTLKLSILANTQPTSTILYWYVIKGKPTKPIVYSKPFTIDSNSTVRSYVVSGKDTSAIAEARFYKLRHNYEVTLVTKPDPQYSASGALTLIDGISGDRDWRKGNWLGYQPDNMEVIVDLRKAKDISYLSLSCLQDTRSWILFPVQVSYYWSSDNKEFKLLGTVENTKKADDLDVQKQRFTLQLPSEMKMRYVKVVAKNFGDLPQWHQGRGGKAYIFTDELEIR